MEDNKDNKRLYCPHMDTASNSAEGSGKPPIGAKKDKNNPGNKKKNETDHGKKPKRIEKLIGI